MLREIYIRSTDDPNYRGPRVVDFEDDVESIITQLRVIMGTSKGQILGSYNFGLDIEDLIFSTSFSAGDLESKLNDQIGQYIAPSFPNYNVTTKVNFGNHPDGWDYAIVDIYINEMKVIGIEVS